MARRSSTKSIHAVIAIGLAAATALIAVVALEPLPRLIWNASDSVPKGLYVVRRIAPRVGEIAVLKLPDWAALLADQRRYLPRNAWLLKPVRAVGGTIVCRFGRYIFIDGKLVAKALAVDKSDRPMPVWRNCRTLKMVEYFLFSRPPDSFDGRYFGPVDGSLIIGTAHPLIIIGK